MRVPQSRRHLDAAPPPVDIGRPMPNRRDVVFVNGRFLAQPLTGVQRFAREIVQAIDRLLDDRSRSLPEVRLLAPRTPCPALPLRNIAVERVGPLRGHLWEQLVLPVAARGGVLLSLGSSGPIGHRAQFLTIHDAGVFANPHNFTPSFRAWYRWLHRRLGRGPARVLTVSQFSKSELIRYCGLTAERIDVVYNGCDHIERQPAATSLLAANGIVPGRYVLCVGWSSPNKNFRLVVEAVRRLEAPQLDIVAVGASNPDVFQPGSQVDAVRVRDLGHVSDAELRALYENALCLAYPSLYEGFGIPPLEAMACGCPVIASRSSALPECCGDAALFCDPSDPAELALHLRALLGDDGSLRQRLVEAGRARAARFRWHDAASRVLEAIRRSAGARGVAA